MEKEKFYKPETNELKSKAEEVISIFQKANEIEDEVEKLELLKEFNEKLPAIATPEGERVPVVSMYQLKKIFIEGRGQDDNSNYLVVGQGTDGQRIWFLNEMEIDGNDITSEDGKPRWMYYQKPSGSSKRYGDPFWNRYMDAFGEETVDLLGK